MIIFGLKPLLCNKNENTNLAVSNTGLYTGLHVTYKPSVHINPQLS